MFRSTIILIVKIDSLEHILQQECLLNHRQPVLVGVSGGPDSICLLHGLQAAGYPAVVAHFNHQLRPESKSESIFVLKLAQEWNLPAITETADVKIFAHENRLSIEEAARELRYEFLFRAANQIDAQAVAVGHNADDQVETILMHLLRGAGPAGLRGMRFRNLPNPWSATIPLIRPLLATWRLDIEAYVNSHQLAFVKDSSNLDPVYYRNRLRHEVIPYLQTLNPQIKQALWQTAEIVGIDYEFLAAEIQRVWDSDLIQKTEPGVVGMDREEFSRLSQSLQRELLRRGAFEIQPGLRDFDYEAIQRALNAVQKPLSHQQIDLVSGMRLIIEPDWLWLMRRDANLPADEWPQIQPDGRRLLSMNDQVLLANHWELRTELRIKHDEITQAAMQNSDAFQAWADADQITQPLALRARLPGDKIQVLGMHGQHTKLSDLFINRKIPRRARSYWPVIVSGEMIVWVPGVQLAHPVRLTETTKRVLHLSLLRI